MSHQWQSDTSVADAVVLARSMIVNFDDITIGSSGTKEVPNGYHGLFWNAFVAIRPSSSDFDEDSGYYAGITSDGQGAFDLYGRNCSVRLDGGSFTLKSVNLTAAWNRSMDVVITGRRHGEMIYHEVVHLTDKAPLSVQLHFTGVDQVVFEPRPGIPDRSLDGHGDVVVFDDIRFSNIKSDVAASTIGDFELASDAALSSSGHLHNPHIYGLVELHHLGLTIA